MSQTQDNHISFIKSLKSEHRSIISTMYEIDHQANGPGDLENSTEKLKKITDLLFAHLEKEDKELYPLLLNNKETKELAKKYSYDMERLSTIAYDFFNRYCVNKEGLKIFIEDFINGYSLFKGLLKVRIKREELELYPAFVLLQSGILYSEVLEYVQKQEAKHYTEQKKVIVFGHNEPYLKAIELALQICGHEAVSINSTNQIVSMLPTANSNLLLLDVTKSDKEIADLIKHLREQDNHSTPIIGYSTNETNIIEETISQNLDAFIPQISINMETFSEKIKQLLD